MINKELTITFTEYQVTQNNINVIGTPRPVKVSDLIIQIANTPQGQLGFGDIKEQKKRMDIITKCEGAKVDANIKLEKAECEFLVDMLEKNHFKVNLIDKDLIKFQEDVLRLTK